jgi:DNA-binding transcriptional LysR family regulator
VEKTAAADTLRGIPLIVLPRRIAPFFDDAILARFRDAGLAPVIGQEAIRMHSIVGLVSAGMSIALVPQSVSTLKRPGAEYRPLPNRTPLIETGLAWGRDNAPPVLIAFLTLSRKKNKC